MPRLFALGVIFTVVFTCSVVSPVLGGLLCEGGEKLGHRFTGLLLCKICFFLEIILRTQDIQFDSFELIVHFCRWVVFRDASGTNTVITGAVQKRPPPPPTLLHPMPHGEWWSTCVFIAQSCFVSGKDKGESMLNYPPGFSGHLAVTPTQRNPATHNQGVGSLSQILCLRGNVSAPGARRASFWTRAPPVAF